MREAMEIDFSHWGLPPLYVGGNVGYSWYDGKLDDLEAPVELMDRMVANAQYHIDNNIELKGLEDPRSYWAEEIIKFNLEIMDSESTLGYIDPDFDEEVRVPIETLDDALKSTRIAKYATHDAYVVNNISRGNYILGMVMLKGHEEVYNNLANILHNGEEVAIKNLNKLVDSGLSFEEAKQILPMRTCAEYFGDFGGDVLNYILEHNIEIKSVTLNSKGWGIDSITIEDGYNQTVTIPKSNYTLKYVEPKPVGQRLEELEQSLKDEVDRMFTVEGNNLTVIADKIEPKTLSLIFNLLMETRKLNGILTDPSTPTYNVSILFETINESKHIPNKALVADFVEPIKKLVYADVVGKNIFQDIDLEISECAKKVFSF